MIFIPCIGGLSHNEAEDVHFKDASQGADVLLNAILNYDQKCAGSMRQKQTEAI